MKVLHLIAPIAFGGGESLLINLLAEKKADLQEEIALVYDSIRFREGLNQIQIPVHLLSTHQSGQSFSRPGALLRLAGNLLKVRKLKRIIQIHKIDIVHAHGFPAVILAYLIKKKMPVKTVYTHHFYRRKPRNKIEEQLFTRVYNNFDARTAVSRTTTDSLHTAFPAAQSFLTIENCLSRSFFEKQSKLQGIAKNITGHKSEGNSARQRLKKFRDPACTCFIQIARFAPGKNQLLVLESLLELPVKQRSSIQIVFAGTGELEAQAREFVNQHGLNSCVLFLGMVAHQEISELIGMCDYGLFPSDLEGFGLGAVECIALGKPVLAQDNALMQEVVASHGLLVARENFDRGLLEIQQLKFNQSTLKKYAASYHPEKIKSKYIELYNRILTS